MKLTFEKNTVCRLALDGKWSRRAAAWMGLSIFLRMVYYFGLMNLRDVPGFEIFFSVALTLAVCVAFILTLRLPKLHFPIVTLGLSLGFAALTFFGGALNFGTILSSLVTLALAGLILAAFLGYIPERKWLLWAGIAALAVRILLVDLGCLLPLTELDLFGYVRVSSTLFGTAAIASLGAALELKKAE